MNCDRRDEGNPHRTLNKHSILQVDEEDCWTLSREWEKRFHIENERREDIDLNKQLLLVHAIKMFRFLQQLKKTSKKDRNGKGEYFLLFLQNKARMEIARRHGSAIFLDATYQTNVYGFPLFFIVIVDPSGHGRIVAAFITQFEVVYSIEHGLLEFKKANTEVDPCTFMIDFYELEEDAITRVFPTANVLIW